MPGPDISVRLGRLFLRNPVMTASGTFGYGQEYGCFIDLNQLGGIIVKGTSLMPRLGNPPARIVEVVGGTLSSVGLHNVGVERFIKEKLPYLRKLDSRIIVNIFGASVSDYHEVARRLEGIDGVSGVEVNISCPNVKEGGVVFGSYPDQTYKVVKSVRDATTLPLMVKLSPNVTDITVIARAAAEAGAEILSLINNPIGLAIDINSRKPMLGNVTGGLAGPAIKPIALRMVWEVYKARLGLPLVGIGGIMSSRDAIEFIIAGASAVQVGSASFVDPQTSLKITAGIKQYCSDNGIENIADLVGTLKY
ncbi:MAG: dihydroorotate dehydrogenase B catalytic subunit [Deltaproteobacteria bacterium GWA2_57_13]|nr:MAG: dihydroorotate dehydrogenase B catalytic subunit [Deltaproteobacteria bacterium GWA2_57_13]